MTRAVVYVDSSGLIENRGMVRLKIVCTFAPYIKHHSFQLEIPHDEFVALLRKKSGLKDTPPDVESGRIEPGWEPYRNVIVTEHEMQLTLHCPFCGKELVVIVRLPDWSRNIVLAAVEQEMEQNAPAPDWTGTSIQKSDLEAHHAD